MRTVNQVLVTTLEDRLQKLESKEKLYAARLQAAQTELKETKAALGELTRDKP